MLMQIIVCAELAGAAGRLAVASSMTGSCGRGADCGAAAAGARSAAHRALPTTRCRCCWSPRCCGCWSPSGSISALVLVARRGRWRESSGLLDAAVAAPARAPPRRSRRGRIRRCMPRAGDGRLCAQLLSGGADRAAGALLHLRAVPHPLRFDDADAAGRRFHHRQQVRLRSALPVVNKKFVDIGEPQRGDVVVFRYPPDPAVNYIKRLVGLPGDHVQVANDR